MRLIPACFIFGNHHNIVTVTWKTSVFLVVVTMLVVLLSNCMFISLEDFECRISAGLVFAALQVQLCGLADCGGQRKHMALCVVGPDMLRLSIDQDICLRE